MSEQASVEADDTASPSRFPAVYLLTGYYKNGNQLSTLEPLINTIIFADDPAESNIENGKPVILRTDKNGKLNTLTNSGTLETRQLFHAHKERKIIIPPADAVSYMAAATGQSWADELFNFANKYAPEEALQTFELQNVPYKNLRKPQTEQGNLDTDSEYKKWYDNLPKNKPIKAYVIEKTRAIFLIVKKSISLDLDPDQSKLQNPKGETESILWIEDNEDFWIGIVIGDEAHLPKGLYKMSIAVEEPYDDEKPYWNSPIRNSEPRYFLSEMINFDVQNAAGEFDIINCDPVSVEEALIVQYPRFYTHLLNAAKDLTPTHIAKNPKKVDDGDTELTGMAKIGDQPKDPAKGYLDFAFSWAAMKEKAQLAVGLTSVDLRTYTADGSTYNGKKELSWKVAEVLHGQLDASADAKVKAVLSSVFATKSAADAWTDFHKARKDYLDALNSETGLVSWQQAIKDEYFKLPQNSPEDLLKHQNTTLGKLGIPKVGLDVFGKVTAIADFYSSASALADTGHTFFTSTLPNFSKSKDDYKAVTKDYFNRLGKRIVMDNARLNGVFDFDKDIVKAEFSMEIAEHAKKIIQAIQYDDKFRVMVAGHTCDLGTNAYNLDLSQRRAIAVKNALVNAGVPAERIDATGYGSDMPYVEPASLLPMPISLESNPEFPLVLKNDSEIEKRRSLNRRVEIITHTSDTSNIYPSREGMGSVERYRNLTVQNSLDVDKKVMEMASQATDIALGVMSVIPATAPVAAGIALVRAGSDALVSLGGLIDEVFMDNVLKQFFEDAKKQQTLTKESQANQQLLYSLFQGIKDKSKAPNEIQWAAQFRVRAESLAGLTGLLMRAAIGADDEAEFYARVKKYHIQAYIENFVLSDQWMYPLNGLSILRMDTYWLYAINTVERKYETLDYKAKEVQFGLDENNRLVNSETRAQLKTEAINKLKNAQPISNTGAYGGGYMMSYAPLRNLTDHLTTSYQSYFPIHRMGTRDIERFAETFNPVFSNYTSANFLATRVYFKVSHDAKYWTCFGESAGQETVRYGRRNNLSKQVAKPIRPFTPVRVLVVFDDEMAAVAPLSFQVIRSDGWDIQGPVYKELAKELTKDDLLDSEQEYAGKVGCVFYPFFQLWDKTYMGIKPLASPSAIGLLGAQRYYNWGFLNDMRYRIKCTLADNSRASIYVPFKSKVDSDGKIITSGDYSSPALDELRVEVNTKEYPGESSLILGDFLTSDTSEFDYPNLFESGVRIIPLIKIGKDSPYILADNNLIVDFKDNYKTIENTCNVTLKAADDRLTINGFDWETPIEFIFIVSCTELDLAGYDENTDGKDWRVIPASASFFDMKEGLSNLFTSDVEGPEFKKSLVYMGKATRSFGGARNTFASDLSFDSSKNKVDKEMDLHAVLDILESSPKRGWSINRLAKRQNFPT